VRLVSVVAYVNGQPRSIFDILGDPWLAGILSKEGPIVRLAGLMDASNAAEQADQGYGCTVTGAC
jgi:hypothetical protein